MLPTTKMTVERVFFNTEKKDCWFGLLISLDSALLPTRISTDRGDFDVEPVQQFDFRNRSVFIEAVKNAIRTGNPPGEAPPKEVRRPTPMEKMWLAKSWADLEKKSICFTIKVFPSSFQVLSWGRAPDGTWSDDEELSLNL